MATVASSYKYEWDSDSRKKRLQHLVSPHLESFNYFVTEGLADAINDIPSMEMKLSDSLNIKMYFLNSQIASPQKNEGLGDNKLTPREARERAMSYSGSLNATVNIELSNGTSFSIYFKCGDLPIMVMSEKCHLHGLSERQLIQSKEESHEMGGYFVVNGIERVIRLLQIPRRNHAFAIDRSSFKKRGPSYSDKGVTMRCVRKDQSSITLTLHFLTNGGATIRFTLRKQEFLLPVIIVAKALCNISDKELFDRIVVGDLNNTFLTTRLELLLRDAKKFNVSSQSECAAYLGSHFRQYLPISDATNDEAAGMLLIKRFIFVHVSNNGAKMECLMHMIRKLFSFAQGNCAADNPDAMMNHEILQPGHLLTIYVKEKLEDLLLNLKQTIMRSYRENSSKCLQEVNTAEFYRKNFERFGGSIGSKIASFLSTGNIVSSSGLDLMQVSGYTIVAERLNMFRYMSHFQAIHRGQFFTTMKTTLVRKLLPESWGFLCPVHTPDGSPCGLLNHVTRDAVIVSHPTSTKLPPHFLNYQSISLNKQFINVEVTDVPLPQDSSEWLSGNALKRLFVSLGVEPCGLGMADGNAINTIDDLPVTLNGVIVGAIHFSRAKDFVNQLRALKTVGQRSQRIDPTTEICYIAHSDSKNKAFSGVYLFTDPGRMIRPVYNLIHKSIEWIGPMEQVFMDIACTKADINATTTHIEISPTAMLSHIASLTPFSDYNQSPRNMYQCQMGKQTMGTPTHAFKHRADNKLFRIQNVHSPLVRTQAFNDYCMDEYPQGVNAVVAVISFTGYDMEDAMIINKSSFERGFGHGSVYKTAEYDLDEEEKRCIKEGVRPSFNFSNIKSLKSIEGKVELYHEHLDLDGLPSEGQLIEYGQVICCLVDAVTGQNMDIKHKDAESAFVDTVRIIGSGAISSTHSAKKSVLRKVSITMRFRRDPIIGDKFSSRHGQKGTLSVLWPQESMPFTESGMTPDVLINPHAFPSRMTIGMLIESMAGKAGAMHGMFHDATPFQFHEKRRAIDYFGEQLRAIGYSYYGSEPLYNGLTGNLMHADIFIGVVFYQRLRHMVSDKAQARSTGPVVALTRQPVKGRKKHGGIRLGEMERDSLLSHGVAFCLQDRLMNCSDAHVAFACSKCQSLLTVYSRSHAAIRNAAGTMRHSSQYCIKCKSGANIKALNLPYVYRFLTNELAAMGIKLSINISDY